MDSLDLCNAIRMEFGGILEDKIPLNAFPAKIQDMVLALARQEKIYDGFSFGGNFNSHR